MNKYKIYVLFMILISVNIYYNSYLRIVVSAIKNIKVEQKHIKENGYIPFYLTYGAAGLPIGGGIRIGYVLNNGYINEKNKKTELIIPFAEGGFAYELPLYYYAFPIKLSIKSYNFFIPFDVQEKIAKECKNDLFELAGWGGGGAVRIVKNDEKVNYLFISSHPGTYAGYYIILGKNKAKEWNLL
ncbi:MAG: hypothetical protein LHV68_02255 [Elusimicrobia bacterium]|nr:hypothetical protein [Candidatus Liberimonas magnetica]